MERAIEGRRRVSDIVGLDYSSTPFYLCMYLHCLNVLISMMTCIQNGSGSQLHKKTAEITETRSDKNNRQNILQN